MQEECLTQDALCAFRVPGKDSQHAGILLHIKSLS